MITQTHSSLFFFSKTIVLAEKNRLLKQFIGHAGPALTTAVTQSSLTHQACRASESLIIIIIIIIIYTFV